MYKYISNTLKEVGEIPKTEGSELDIQNDSDLSFEKQKKERKNKTVSLKD